VTKTARILIVSVDPTLVRTLTACLNELGHVVCAVVAGSDAGSARLNPDLAVVDLGLDQEAGAAIEAAKQIEHRLEAPVLYLAESIDDPRLQRACAMVPFGYLVKPVDARQLRRGIDAALIAHGRERKIGETAAARAPAAQRGRSRSKRDADWAASLAKTIIEASAEGIAVVDAAGRFRRVNSAGRSMGRDTLPAERVDEWLSRYQVFHNDGQTPFADDDLPHARALRGEGSDDVNLVVKSEASEENARAHLHVSVSAKTIRNSAGCVLGALILVRDITDTVRTATDLQRTVSLLHQRAQVSDAILRSMSDGVVVVDKDLNFTLFNPSAERIIGIGITNSEASEWTEKYGIFFPDKVTPVPTDQLPLVRAVNGEHVDDLNLFICNPIIPDGVFISVNATPVRDNHNQLVGGVAVFRDVSRQVLEQEALMKAFASGRHEAIDTILHNIGNAINSVAAGVGTVREKLRDNELQCRFVSLADLIREHEGDWASWLTSNPQGRRMVPYLLMLIKDLASSNSELLLTVRRVRTRVSHIVDIIRTQETFSSGTVERKLTSLKSIIDDAVGVLRESLSKRSIKVDVDCSRAPDEISVQESKFHQMLVNLVKNAIEAIDELAAIPSNRRLELDPGVRADPPGAEPRIRIVAREEGNVLSVEVSDTGIGIGTTHLESMFAAGYTTKERGSGLGLHSIANFVVSAGGRVQADSEGIGFGATVRVMLPLHDRPDKSTNDVSLRSVSSAGPGT
jgi:signal transduction histidine kinase/CheY-like chemotaxis protein